MRSGIAGRADAGAQARQFNASPTPATALPAIHDHGAPRPARQPGLQLATSRTGLDASHDAGRDGPASPRHELGKRTPALASETQPQRARQPGRPPRDGGGKRVFAGPPETVAGTGSSPARNGSPLAGKQVFDNGNTSGHVPQHARQLCRGPGDGGRRRVSRRAGIGSHAGRESGHP